MSTATGKPKVPLNDSHRDWVTRMGAVLNVNTTGAAPAASASTPPASATKIVLTVVPSGPTKEKDKLTLTAVVTPAAPKLALTGTVRFDVVLNTTGGRITLNKVPLTDGKAVYIDTHLTKGKHLLDAFFSSFAKTAADSQSAQVPHEIIALTDADFAAARKSALSKFDDCMVSARNFKDLKKERKELISARDEMEAAGKAHDFRRGKDLAGFLENRAKYYLQEAAKKQAAFDKLGADVSKSLNDAKDDATRASAARDWVNNKLTPDEKIKYLPSDVRNQLMDALTKKLTHDNKRALDKFYSVRVLDPEFEKDDKQKTDKLIELLKSDPEMKKARKDWPTMQRDDRIKLMQKIADLQCQVYGTTHIKGAKDLVVDWKDEDPEPDGSITMGEYNHGTGKFTLNMNPKNPALKNFDEAIETAVHEAGHRYQSMLAAQSANGDLKPGDPLYNEARTFELNDKYYAYKPFDVYSNQPQESHSRVSSARIRNAHIGK